MKGKSGWRRSRTEEDKKRIKGKGKKGRERGREGDCRRKIAGELKGRKRGRGGEGAIHKIRKGECGR